MNVQSVDLIFTPEALSATAQRAEERKTGVRGLRTAVEAVLIDGMFEITSVDKGVIGN